LPDYFTNQEKADLTETEKDFGSFTMKSRVETVLKSYFVIPKEAIDSSYDGGSNLSYYSYGNSGINASLGDDQIIMWIAELKGEYKAEALKQTVHFTIDLVTAVGTLKMNEVAVLNWD
jgi:hypothetical protein